MTSELVEVKSISLLGHPLNSGYPGVGIASGPGIKDLPATAGNLGWIPGSGRSPGEGNGNLLQNSCLRNPMERGAWQATVHGVAKSQTRLSD